jgi:hypothetical protein
MHRMYDFVLYEFIYSIRQETKILMGSEPSTTLYTLPPATVSSGSTKFFKKYILYALYMILISKKMTSQKKFWGNQIGAI